MTKQLQLHVGCRIAAQTPEGHQHFFGFHDVSPWSHDDKMLAVLRVPPELRATPKSSDSAEVCVWEPDASALRRLAATRAFNWQQGARVQWLPAAPGQLVFNDIQEGRPVSRVLDVSEGLAGPVVPAVYALHPSGSFGLAPDWHRLSEFWRGYSYDLPAGGRPGCGEPGDLRRVEIPDGREGVLVPIAEVRGLCGQGTGAAASDFLSHATFSPSGARLCFMYRRFSEDGALFSFFLACNADGSGLRVLAREKCSHFDWLDDDRLMIWTRKLPGQAAALRAGGWTKRFPFKQMVKLLRTLNPNLKQSLFAESYYEVDYLQPGQMKPVGAGALEQDGHPMFTPDRKWMVTDTYVFEGSQPLILFRMADGKRFDVARFPAHPEFLAPELKCDLHPRLDRSGRRVAVDSAHSGMRQLYVVDIGEFLDAGLD